MKLKSKRPEVDISPACKLELKKTIDREMQLFRKTVYDNMILQQQAFKEMKDRFESWEETMLVVYHNIKKNQFLYSHYPDDWAKKYSDIKAGLRNENEHLDEKKITAV